MEEKTYVLSRRASVANHLLVLARKQVHGHDELVYLHQIVFKRNAKAVGRKFRIEVADAKRGAQPDRLVGNGLQLLAKMLGNGGFGNIQ